MDKRGFSSTEHNTKMIIDTMKSQTKHITEEIVRKSDKIIIKVIEGSVTNSSNIMDIVIE